MFADSTDFATPWAQDDAIIEASCAVSDDAWGPPELWPSWTDRYQFAVGPDNTPDPDDDDRFVPAFDPTWVDPDPDPDSDDDHDLVPLDPDFDDDDLWFVHPDDDDPDPTAEWPVLQPAPEDEARGWSGHSGDEPHWTDLLSVEHF